MKKGRCPKCGSKDLITDAEVRDDGRSGQHPLRVIVAEPEPAKHGAIWVQAQAEGDIHAWICGHCGYTELYTDHLEELYAAYRKRR